MKSSAEGSGSSRPYRGRTTHTVLRLCLALPLLGACSPHVGAEQKPGAQDPGIQIQSPGTLEKPAPVQRSGLFVAALVCKGYVAVDGNRWVQNPIVDGAQAEKGNYTPMTVSHHYDALDINPSMPQANLQYYDQSGNALPRGRKPICTTRFLKIATVNTDFPNMVDPKKPNAMAYHTFSDAYTDAVNARPSADLPWNLPKNPGHVYSVTFGKDPLMNDHLANVERTF